MTAVASQVREAVRALKAAADPERAKGMAWYFKKDEDLRFFGIKTPHVRQLEKAQFAALPDDNMRDALAFADAMILRPELESKVYGCARLHHYTGKFSAAVLPACARWLRNDNLASWVGVDVVCHQVVSPYVKQRPEHLERTQKWGTHRSLWMRRASVVVFVPFVRKGNLQDPAYDAVNRHLGDPEDLMHKAVGWVLREAGNADRDRLEQFLLDRGTELARTTVRYAIEKFPERRRKQLLKLTSVAG